jgi:hypothetical protein
MDSVSFFAGIGVGLVFTYLYRLIELEIRETKLKNSKER